MNDAIETTIHCPVHTLPDFEPCAPAEIEPLLEYLRRDAPIEQAQVFPRGTVLEDGRLDLCKQQLGAHNCLSLVDALQENTHVRSLMLGTDAIGDEGAQAVARAIENNAQLQVIYLGCNRITEIGAHFLSDALKDNDSVTGLWLKRNPLGDAGALAIAQMLRTNTHLRTLDMVNTGIGRAGLNALLQVLAKKNRTLQRLYLGGNGLDELCAISIAEMLRANNSLNALFLNVNHLGDLGAETIADALAHNTNLRELGLASNGLSAHGIAALLKAPTLQILDLGYSASTRALGAQRNALGEDAIEIIAPLLRENRTLRRLNLGGNRVDEVTQNLLCAALQNNTTLQILAFDGAVSPNLQALLARNRASHDEKLGVPDDVKLIRSVYRTAPK